MQSDITDDDIYIHSIRPWTMNSLVASTYSKVCLLSKCMVLRLVYLMYYYDDYKFESYLLLTYLNHLSGSLSLSSVFIHLVTCM